MTIISWSPGILLPGPMVAVIGALRVAVEQLQIMREKPDDLRDALTRTRQVFDHLERLAARSELAYLDFARHLRFAERYILEDRFPDPDDLMAMRTRDLVRLVRRIEERELLPADTAGLRAAQASLEGPAVEFKKAFPGQARDLAHEFAALAPEGGWLYLGVDDDGSVAGLDFNEPADVDRCDLRVRNLAGTVSPAVAIATTWLADGGRIVGALRVLRSGEPIHYVDGRPYVRDGSVSRPARPEEVKQRILQMSGSRRPRLHINDLQLAQEGRGPALKDLIVRALVSNVGNGTALSVRGYMDHPQLTVRSASEHFDSFEMDSGQRTLLLGMVEGQRSHDLLAPVEATFEARIEYRDPDGQWWATTALFWVGAVVAGFEQPKAHLDDQQERVTAIGGPRAGRDVWRGPWEGDATDEDAATNAETS